MTSSMIFSDTLLRCVKQHSKCAFATAWASSDTNVFTHITKNKSLVSKAVIGIHFYQTHPDVLDHFIGADNVRFILQPAGVFHLKVYLFWTGPVWEALIGSANLTKAALSTNTESMLLISSEDKAASSFRADLLTFVKSCWSEAKTITKSDAEAYRAIWMIKQPKLKNLSGQYGFTISQKSPIGSSVMSMVWHQFLGEVKNDAEHGYEERCELLRVARAAFEEHGSLASMNAGLRKVIAGLPTDTDHRWGWFGSMRGNGKFWSEINKNNQHLSRALDRIPNTGIVTRGAYEDYTAEFLLAFPNGRGGIATATRLLALKRPDQFVCFDARNKDELCKDFGIRSNGMDHSRYWDEVVERIRDAPWWNAAQPTRVSEIAVWRGRAAMLDAIFYRAE